MTLVFSRSFDVALLAPSCAFKSEEVVQPRSTRTAALFVGRKTSAWAVPPPLVGDRAPARRLAASFCGHRVRPSTATAKRSGFHDVAGSSGCRSSDVGRGGGAWRLAYGHASGVWPNATAVDRNRAVTAAVQVKACLIVMAELAGGSWGRGNRRRCVRWRGREHPR